MSLLDPRLQAFVQITQTGTVHGAASRLGLTQTGITQRIRALEKQLSTTLFMRSRSGMKLTQEGEALLRYCKEAESIEGQTLGEISGSARSSVSITLAGPTSIVSSRVIPECLRIYELFPHVLLNYRLDDSENRIELLKKGAAQLVVVPPSEVTLELDSKILKPDRYVLVATTRWKGRRTRDLISTERMIDFYESDQTTKRYLEKFELLGRSRKERLFANTNFALMTLLKAGIGYGTLTLEVAKPSIERGELIVLNNNQVLEDPQALAWYPRHQMPEYLEEIIRSVK
ncbi:MAG: LysR family transcriptional regulator [Proteobacteria bacterium]|nr:MAG: LysR family transcriptional regulator [Pseudomonadota bacterium]